MEKEKKMSDSGQQNRKWWQSILLKTIPCKQLYANLSPVALFGGRPLNCPALRSGANALIHPVELLIRASTPSNFARHTMTFSLRFRLSFQDVCCHSGLGLRAIRICKPRQVRKKATVVDTRMCRGTTRGLASLRKLYLLTLNQGRFLSSEDPC